MGDTFHHGRSLRFEDVSAPPLRHADLICWSERVVIFVQTGERVERYSASVRRIVSRPAGVTLSCVGLLLQIVRETTEFIRDVRCPQSKTTQRSSRIAEKHG